MDRQHANLHDLQDATQESTLLFGDFGPIFRCSSSFQAVNNVHNLFCRTLAAQPIATLLTVAVIGIALALPGSLNMLVQNGRHLAGGWETVRDFSVYLKPGSSEKMATELAVELRQDPLIESVEFAGEPTMAQTTFVGGPKALPIRYTLRDDS